MYKYTIKFSKSSKDDIARIVEYISNTLNEPQIAISFADLLFSEINSLHILPKRNPILNGNSTLDLERRKFVVKNYVVLYYVSEIEKAVYIERVVYAASDWMNKI